MMTGIKQRIIGAYEIADGGEHGEVMNDFGSQPAWHGLASVLFRLYDGEEKIKALLAEKRCEYP